jgi:4-amino-4-deoxy-L-arabinose transferase-like glycosyltransferase
VLWAILVLSFVLKVALLIPAHNVSPVGDSMDYVLGAQAIAMRGTYPGERPPLYPAVLAATFAAAAWVGVPMPNAAPPTDAGLTGLDVARLVQVIMSTISVWLLYLLGRTLFDTRSAMIGAAVFAFYPNFVGFSHLLWSETLSVMLSLAALLLLFRGLRPWRPGILIGAGICCGLAALTRQVGLTLIPWIVVWLVVFGAATWRSRGYGALAIVIGAALTIAPWTARNAWKYGEFVPVTSVSGKALLWGASPNPQPELKRIRRTWPPGPRRDAAARERAAELIRADPAGWLTRCRIRNQLWSPAFDGVVMHLGQPWGYPAARGRLAHLIVAIVVGAYMLVSVCAIAGMAIAPDWRTTLLFVGFLGAYSALHFLASGFPRHRLPLMAYACIYAGYLVSRRPAELRVLARPLRVGIAAAGLLAFLSIATAENPRLRRVLDRLDKPDAPTALFQAPEGIAASG